MRRKILTNTLAISFIAAFFLATFWMYSCDQCGTGDPVIKPPRIIKTIPANGEGTGPSEMGVPSETSIQVEFDRPINTVITEPVHITITDDRENDIPYTISWVLDQGSTYGKILNIYPVNPLPRGTLVTVLLVGFVDANNVIMVQEYAFTFGVEKVISNIAEYDGETTITRYLDEDDNSIEIELPFKHGTNENPYAKPNEETMIPENFQIEPALEGVEVFSVNRNSDYSYSIVITGVTDGASFNLILTTNIKDFYNRVLQDAPFQIFIEVKKDVGLPYIKLEQSNIQIGSWPCDRPYYKFHIEFSEDVVGVSIDTDSVWIKGENGEKVDLSNLKQISASEYEFEVGTEVSGNIVNGLENGVLYQLTFGKAIKDLNGQPLRSDYELFWLPVCLAECKVTSYIEQENTTKEDCPADDEEGNTNGLLTQNDERTYPEFDFEKQQTSLFNIEGVLQVFPSKDGCGTAAVDIFSLGKFRKIDDFVFKISWTISGAQSTVAYANGGGIWISLLDGEGRVLYRITNAHIKQVGGTSQGAHSVIAPAYFIDDVNYYIRLEAQPDVRPIETESLDYCISILPIKIPYPDCGENCADPCDEGDVFEEQAIEKGLYHWIMKPRAWRDDNDGIFYLNKEAPPIYYHPSCDGGGEDPDPQFTTAIDGVFKFTKQTADKVLHMRVKQLANTIFNTNGFISHQVIEVRQGKCGDPDYHVYPEGNVVFCRDLSVDEVFAAEQWFDGLEPGDYYIWVDSAEEGNYDFAGVDLLLEEIEVGIGENCDNAIAVNPFYPIPGTSSLKSDNTTEELGLLSTIRVRDTECIPDALEVWYSFTMEPGYYILGVKADKPDSFLLFDHVTQEEVCIERATTLQLYAVEPGREYCLAFSTNTEINNLTLFQYERLRGDHCGIIATESDGYSEVVGVNYFTEWNFPTGLPGSPDEESSGEGDEINEGEHVFMCVKKPGGGSLDESQLTGADAVVEYRKKSDSSVLYIEVSQAEEYQTERYLVVDVLKENCDWNMFPPGEIATENLSDFCAISGYNTMGSGLETDPAETNKEILFDGNAFEILPKGDYWVWMGRGQKGQSWRPTSIKISEINPTPGDICDLGNELYLQSDTSHKADIDPNLGNYVESLMDSDVRIGLPYSKYECILDGYNVVWFRLKMPEDKSLLKVALNKALDMAVFVGNNTLEIPKTFMECKNMPVSKIHAPTFPTAQDPVLIQVGKGADVCLAFQAGTDLSWIYVDAVKASGGEDCADPATVNDPDVVVNNTGGKESYTWKFPTERQDFGQRDDYDFSEPPACVSDDAKVGKDIVIKYRKKYDHDVSTLQVTVDHTPYDVARPSRVRILKGACTLFDQEGNPTGAVELLCDSSPSLDRKSIDLVGEVMQKDFDYYVWITFQKSPEGIDEWLGADVTVAEIVPMVGGECHIAPMATLYADETPYINVVDTTVSDDYDNSIGNFPGGSQCLPDEEILIWYRVEVKGPSNANRMSVKAVFDPSELATNIPVGMRVSKNSIQDCTLVFNEEVGLDIPETEFVLHTEDISTMAWSWDDSDAYVCLALKANAPVTTLILQTYLATGAEDCENPGLYTRYTPKITYKPFVGESEKDNVGQKSDHVFGCDIESHPNDIVVEFPGGSGAYYDITGPGANAVLSFTVNYATYAVGYPMMEIYYGDCYGKIGQTIKPFCGKADSATKEVEYILRDPYTYTDDGLSGKYYVWIGTADQDTAAFEDTDVTIQEWVVGTNESCDMATVLPHPLDFEDEFDINPLSSYRSDVDHRIVIPSCVDTEGRPDARKIFFVKLTHPGPDNTLLRVQTGKVATPDPLNRELTVYRSIGGNQVEEVSCLINSTEEKIISVTATDEICLAFPVDSDLDWLKYQFLPKPDGEDCTRPALSSDAAQCANHALCTDESGGTSSKRYVWDFSNDYGGLGDNADHRFTCDPGNGSALGTGGDVVIKYHKVAFDTALRVIVEQDEDAEYYPAVEIIKSNGGVECTGAFNEDTDSNLSVLCRSVGGKTPIKKWDTTVAVENGDYYVWVGNGYAGAPFEGYKITIEEVAPATGESPSKPWSANWNASNTVSFSGVNTHASSLRIIPPEYRDGLGRVRTNQPPCIPPPSNPNDPETKLVWYSVNLDEGYAVMTISAVCPTCNAGELNSGQIATYAYGRLVEGDGLKCNEECGDATCTDCRKDYANLHCEGCINNAINEVEDGLLRILHVGNQANVYFALADGTPITDLTVTQLKYPSGEDCSDPIVLPTYADGIAALPSGLASFKYGSNLDALEEIINARGDHGFKAKLEIAPEKYEKYGMEKDHDFVGCMRNEALGFFTDVQRGNDLVLRYFKESPATQPLYIKLDQLPYNCGFPTSSNPNIDVIRMYDDSTTPLTKDYELNKTLEQTRCDDMDEGESVGYICGRRKDVDKYTLEMELYNQEPGVFYIWLGSNYDDDEFRGGELTIIETTYQLGESWPTAHDIPVGDTEYTLPALTSIYNTVDTECTVLDTNPQEWFHYTLPATAEQVKIDIAAGEHFVIYTMALDGNKKPIVPVVGFDTSPVCRDPEADGSFKFKFDAIGAGHVYIGVSTAASTYPSKFTFTTVF